MRALIAVMLMLGSAQAALGAVYYVGPNGTDRGPGSATAPLGSVGAAVRRARPGDMVVVRAGRYQESIVLPRSGTAGARITLRGLPGAVLVSPDPTRSLSAFDVNAQAYLSIEGFELTGGFDETVFLRPGAHDIELAGLHIHDNHTGVWIAGATDVVLHDSVIEHNVRTGVRIFSGARRIRVVDTRAQNNDDGQGCAGDSDGFNADASTAEIVFERAAAVGNSEDGFDLKGPDMTLLQVTAQDNGCSGVKLWSGGYIENALVVRSGIGIKVGTPAGSMTVVVNCTAVDNNIGLRAEGGPGTVLVRNCVVSGPGKALDYAAGVALQEDHNLLYRPEPTERLIVREDPGGETIFSAVDVNDGTWSRASGQGSGTVARDPGLEPESCAPQPASAAIDSGSGAGAPPIDLMGTPRPMGAGVDRGAFERMTVPPALEVAQLLLRPDGTGSGPLRLEATFTLPPQFWFDSGNDPVTLTLIGARGTLFTVTVDPSQWKRSQASDGPLLRLAQSDASGRRTYLALHVLGDRLGVELSTRCTDLWTVDGNDVTVITQAGRARARAALTLQAVGAGLCAP